MKLTPNEQALVAAAQDRRSDKYGDREDRVIRLINKQAGSPICELAQWATILDLVQKLTPRPKRKA